MAADRQWGGRVLVCFTQDPFLHWAFLAPSLCLQGDGADEAKAGKVTPACLHVKSLLLAGLWSPLWTIGAQGAAAQPTTCCVNIGGGNASASALG